MFLKSEQIQIIANKLVDARSVGTPIPALSNQFDFTMVDAYKIQKILAQDKIEKGDVIIGWKLGYTSLAMRTQMNIDEPNFGPLHQSMYLTSGSILSNYLIQPKVEPEIAVKFKYPLSGNVTFEEVHNAIDSAHGCLEIVDSIFQDYKFNIEDNTADGSSAAQFVIGPEIEKNELDKTEVKFFKNGDIIDQCLGSSASGHPLNGVVWLINCLDKLQAKIEPGEIVITGGLTSSIDINKGDHVYGIFDNTVKVEVFG